MPNATEHDTRAGYDIYMAANGNISLDDLNAQLRQAGYNPIAQRSFTHYRHLIDAGHAQYIPINRFDVDRSSSE